MEGFEAASGIWVLVCCVLLAGGANAALVKVGNLVLTADGGFTPRTLPRSAYAPIDFNGYANLRAVDGSIPPPLQQAGDRLRPRRPAEHRRAADLRPLAAGRSDADRSAQTLPARDRRHRPRRGADRPRRPAAGAGQLAADALQRPAPGRQPDRRSSTPASTVPRGPDLRHHGPDRTRARRLSLPGHGRHAADRRRPRLAHPPRRQRSAGATASSGTERSYVSARCGDGVLSTHGRFTFADGTVIDGSVEKACTVR